MARLKYESVADSFSDWLLAHLAIVNIRVVTLGTGRLSRGKTFALALAALAVGGVFLALGIALLASFAVIGAVIAGGMAIARLVKGRPSLPRNDRPLDPSMEVFPPVTRQAPRLEGDSETR
jgi:hypothetical protein